MTKLEWWAAETRLEQARALADEIVTRLGLEPPIDPLEIVSAERHMLRAVGADFGVCFDGQLEYHPRKRLFLLFFNTKYDLGRGGGGHHPRTRFSIGHELGHYFLDRHRSYLLSGGTTHPSISERYGGVQLEREADSFASALLLPSAQLKPLVNADELCLERIEEIAARFDTSLVSTTLRGVQLSDYPCAVVGMRDGVVAWSFCSQTLIESGLYPPERGSRGSRAAKLSCLAVAEGDRSRSASTAFASEWFRVFDREHLSRLPVMEQYLPVPSIGTMIVLLSIPEDELDMDDD